MPADFLSQNVCETINIFNSKLPELQKQDSICKIIHDFIQNLVNPESNQEPLKTPKVNAGLIKYTQQSLIQDNVLWICRNKME
jgi:hypothetical protein